MRISDSSLHRREFLTRATAAGLAFAGRLPAAGANDGTVATPRKALIAITLDLEMSRNFPTWDQTRWDYEKGNLNAETKKYAVEACRRVKQHGGVLHCFVVGRVLEQENVDWLKEIIAAGHPIGNHTYDHVNVTATKPQDIQFRFRRAPLAHSGTNAPASHRREHSSHDRGHEAAPGNCARRLPDPGWLRERPGRSAGHSTDAAGPGIHLGKQQTSRSPTR